MKRTKNGIIEIHGDEKREALKLLQEFYANEVRNFEEVYEGQSVYVLWDNGIWEGWVIKDAFMDGLVCWDDFNFFTPAEPEKIWEVIGR